MRFRTEIERPKAPFRIAHTRPVLLLGSCFTDEIGARLEADGFSVLRNPFGPLYNPVSLAACLERAITGPGYTASDLIEGPRGFHCLDYASRFSGPDADILLAELNATRRRLSDFIAQKPVVIITLGSAYVYRFLASGKIVGNCHKLPDSMFCRSMLTPAEAAASLRRIAELLSGAGISDLVFTVSPIRHLAYGLHGNTLSKATLQLAAAEITEHGEAFYFPAYEAMIDDLRDYRFYNADMKHPSQVAVDYIYELFSDTFFTKETLSAAAEARKAYLASLHRQIL